MSEVSTPIGDSDFNDASPCSSVSTGLDLASKNVPLLCRICGDLAQGHHFGGYSCHACGAFFRRSVSNQQNYICARNHTCKVGQGHSRGMCKACRFKRCIAENMRIQAIVVRTTDDMRCFDAVPTLKKIYLAQRATFVNRYAVHLKQCHGNKALVRFGVENPLYKDIEQGMFTEYNVLQQFLRESGFPEFGLTPFEIQNLSNALFCAWICYQSIIITLKNSGHKKQIVYFVEESHMRVEVESMANYINSFISLMDYDLATKHTVDYYSDVLKTVSRISQLRTKDFENAALFQCFALKTAAIMFPKRRPELKQALDRIFDDLKRQYMQTYDNVALRMGNLVLLLSEIENASRSAMQYLTLLHLNGYNSIMPKLELIGS